MKRRVLDVRFHQKRARAIEVLVEIDGEKVWRIPNLRYIEKNLQVDLQTARNMKDGMEYLELTLRGVAVPIPKGRDKR